MPKTTYAIEEFSLATVDGVDTFTTNVALSITYDSERDGAYKIDYAGAITGWVRGIGRELNPIIVWCADHSVLERLIIERAMAKYRTEIEEHIDSCIDEENAPLWRTA